MKLLGLAVMALVSMSAFADQVVCDAYPGQLRFVLADDQKSVEIIQYRYALQDGPATDLARQIGFLPQQHTGPGIESLNVVTGLQSKLDFTLTDGTERMVARLGMKLTLTIDNALQTATVNVNEGAAEVITITSKTTNCLGLPNRN